jgi:HlyD family secretion protein
MKAKILLIVPFVIAAVAGGIWWNKHKAQAPLTELTLHGNVDIRQVELAFNASGRIADILAREGDRVKQGQLLASLDTERLRLSLNQAEAQTGVQRQVVARYLAGSRPEEIRQARASGMPRGWRWRMRKRCTGASSIWWPRTSSPSSRRTAPGSRWTRPGSS